MTEPVQSCFARFETKYFLTRRQYEGMVAGMRAHTAPDVHPTYPIHNIYFDTEGFRLARNSLEQPVYKEKLRLRSYGRVRDGDPVFLEMKKKYRGMVYKRRIVLPFAEAAAYLAHGTRPSADSQILKEIDWLRRCNALQPAAFIGYTREAYAGTEDPELRITFDTELHWRRTALELSAPDTGKPLGPPDAILMEVKFSGVCPFWLAHLMSELGIRRTSYSKYGSCYVEHLLYRPEAPAARPVPAAERHMPAQAAQAAVL